MFDNWYVVQVRTGKEEEIVKKCQFYIDHDILIDCFIPITKKKKKYQGTWHIVDDILFKGYIFMITNQVEQLYTQLKKVPDLTKLLGNDGKEIRQERSCRKNLCNHRPCEGIPEGTGNGRRLRKLCCSG